MSLRPTSKWKKLAPEDDFPHRAHLARGFDKMTALLEAQNHRCAFCGVRLIDPPGRPEALAPTVATIDEVIPRVYGGKPIWSNQVAACHRCNTSRGAACAYTFHAIISKASIADAVGWARGVQRLAGRFGWHSISIQR